MKKPVEGQPTGYDDYFKGKLNAHLAGVLGINGDMAIRLFNRRRPRRQPFVSNQDRELHWLLHSGTYLS